MKFIVKSHEYFMEGYAAKFLKKHFDRKGGCRADIVSSLLRL